MAENKPFKDGLGRPAIRRIARNITRVEPEFADEAFVRSATRGLDKLELKARVRHVIGALRQHLPSDYIEALDVLTRAGAEWDRGDPDDPVRGFAAWPLIDFVGEHGVAHFDASMDALRRLTPLFSAEFAIRPFIDHDTPAALALLHTWVDAEDEHVRRLVSEGTRPRLPWGTRLRGFQADPTPVLALLDKLKDDPELYVRRSVANNLNDIGKDHPEVVVEVCQRWSKNASDERKWVIRHATRSLVKQGHPGALALLGYDPAAKLSIHEFELSADAVTVGDDLQFGFELRSRSKAAQPLVIDYAVHHVKSSGKRTPKVFKLKTLTLKPGARVTVSKTHKFRNISTRTYHAGDHGLEILINGRSRAMAEFDLEP